MYIHRAELKYQIRIRHFIGKANTRRRERYKESERKFIERKIKLNRTLCRELMVMCVGVCMCVALCGLKKSIAIRSVRSRLPTNSIRHGSHVTRRVLFVFCSLTLFVWLPSRFRVVHGSLSGCWKMLSKLIEKLIRNISIWRS